MSSCAISPTPLRISCAATPLTLRVRGCGDIIPFKNRKRIGGRKRNMLITEPRVKKQMQAITDSFVSQLHSALATAGGATWTAAQRRSWIASRLPADDCWTIVPDEHATGQLVSRGDEGADITLEIISDAKNRQREGLPGVAGSEELRGDDREGRGGASPLAGVQTEEPAEPEAAGGLPAEHARAAG